MWSSWQRKMYKTKGIFLEENFFKVSDGIELAQGVLRLALNSEINFGDRKCMSNGLKKEMQIQNVFSCLCETEAS